MESALLLIVIVLIIYMVSGLNSKLNDLNHRVFDLSRKIDALKGNDIPTKAENADVAPKPAAERPPAPVVPPSYTERPAPIPIKEPVRPIIVSPAAPAPAPRPTKTWWVTFKEQNPDLEKFIGENLINKIGVLILVLGISYFVKYAIDKDWINETARAGIGLLCGALVMGVAHKLRKKYAAFSSVLVAGAISIFYFTIAIAFHDYHLFSQTVAFMLMIVITAFSSLISLSYNRIELAILSLIGGFAVPFMVSTGQGNYVVLFSYILILNIGILTLAYHRKWNLVTVLAYIFTAALYGSWLTQAITEDNVPHLGALLFGFAFYFIFILVTIINNLRTKGEFSKVELTILASNTFLFYAAGMVILDDYHPEFRGVFTAAIAMMNLIYAWFLYKKFGLDKKAILLLVGLTLTFITLAVPVQFEGNNITLFWAGEAVLLMWLARRANFPSYRIGSVILHILMIISLIMDWENIYSGSDQIAIVLNPAFLTSLVAVASMVAVIILLKKENEASASSALHYIRKYSRMLIVLAIIIGYIGGFLEVYTQAHTIIDIRSSASAFVVLYHLIFCAILVAFLMRASDNVGHRTAALIASINIILFAFFFSTLAFSEHQNYIESGIMERTAFYLHYISLLLIIFFAYALYQLHKHDVIKAMFSHRIVIWVAAFFIVYISSAELMLHGHILLGTPVTSNEVQSNELLKNSSDADFVRSMIADNRTDDIGNKMVKSALPVLWGVIAFIFLLIGIKKANQPLRIVALTLLGITILKLFIYDIQNVSETGKIIAFILLGILILIISFVYQKIKVLVLNDTTKTDHDV
ncbi:MAG TPA: DUF2339 domain-containing protein [Flavobacterium sp.]|nr:DUF2339 domain-containing protein [Flavobacterium sp.]